MFTGEFIPSRSAGYSLVSLLMLIVTLMIAYIRDLNHPSSRLSISQGACHQHTRSSLKSSS
jgi:hypothetical protein